MGNILKSPSARSNIGYSGFDMSHLEKFSSTTGELLPVHYDILNPGDKVTCNSELKTRTMEIESAAMVRLNEHIDWFFVPLTQILTTFGDWYYGIQDFKTSFLDPSSTYAKNFPYFAATTINSNLHNVTQDAFGIRGSFIRLMDMLGIPASSFSASNSSFSSFPNAISPLFGCAYQKIWMDFYRVSNYNANSPKYYNLDQFFSTGLVTEWGIWTLRYRSADKDFFTNVFPSPLIGEGGVDTYATNTLYENFNQWLVSGLGYFGAQPVVTSGAQGAGTATSDPVTPTDILPNIGYPNINVNNVSVTGVKNIPFRKDVQGFMSPSAIRTSFAMQKLLEVTRRAGKHMDAQTLAHFGVNVPNGIAGEVFYLGSQHGVVNIGDVIATSTGSATINGSTIATPLGQVGGKGYGYTKGDSPIKFTAPCHGVLMALYSSNVDRDYSNDMLDRLNTYVNRSDWFTPEYDNLGMQPLFHYQKHLVGTAATNSSVLAWQYRWTELKLKFNRVSGALQAGRTLSYWSATQEASQFSLGDSLYVSPFELDSIMLVPYGSIGNMVVSVSSGTGYNNNTFANMYSTDPLIHECYIDCKKASKMSTYGLESL